MNILLISTYDLGHQPFGLASPAAWLARAGARVRCLDLAVQALDPALAREAELIALYLPMHTATRLAAELIGRLRELNPRAHLCCYGLYAPLNEPLLRELGAGTILGGEFESGLVALYRQLAEKQEPGSRNQEPDSPSQGRANGSGFPVRSSATISLERLQFLPPDRAGLPPLDAYAYVELPDGERRAAGYTEASRGCKHTCRHCPIVPVYGGQFRVVQPDVVLADVRAQVAPAPSISHLATPTF